MKARRLKVGVVLPTYRRLATAENIRLAAQLSESLGFDSIWVTDHVVVPSASVEAFGPTFYEAVTVMSYVAAITSRVRIGAAILIVPYRHPLVLAKMLATVDQLSDGRVIFGAGLGWLESESHLMGVPHKRRARIADEALGAIRACWEADQPEFHGEAYDFAGFHFAPRPHSNRRLPIFVGGASTAALRRAARFGDGWIGDGQTFEELEVALGQLSKELEAQGRGLGEMEVAMRTGLQVAADRTGITESPSEQGWKSAEFVTAGRTPFRGLREEVVADFKRAAELGVGHLIFEFPVSRGEESMALFDTLAGIREESGV
ncbi:MAG TPA: TIGR03619 family F420-dependent LLM class oxidoreductase [Candidatus Eisenbacteria bacterium]|nr:TIGR03619 family F420-dependent LLM class oxidoreductase [Candidatus Eisenbacteria bacterium]